MRSFSEIYVPSSWTWTTEETPQNQLNTPWPRLGGINENLFDLSVLINSKLDSESDTSKEQFIVNLTYKNNEISLVQETEPTRRKSIIDDDISTGGKDFSYLLKVIDHETNAVMYYDIKLARVEVEKKIMPTDELLDEHLEVITEIDWENDNPFETEFDTPEDYRKEE